MFSLTRWWRNRNRQIFRFFDGKRWRGVDPIVVLTAINTHKDYHGQADMDKLAGKSGAEDCEEAVHRIAGIVSEAFGVGSYDTGGLTVTERLSIFERLHDYLDVVKKNTSSTPISPEPTESTSSEFEDEITNATSVTG